MCMQHLALEIFNLIESPLVTSLAGEEDDAVTLTKPLAFMTGAELPSPMGFAQHLANSFHLRLYFLSTPASECKTWHYSSP